MPAVTIPPGTRQSPISGCPRPELAGGNMPRLTFKETMDRIELLIRAGFPVLYIVSFEETRVLDCIAKVVNRIGKNLATPKSLWRWYEGTGLEFLQPSQQPDSK